MHQLLRFCETQLEWALELIETLVRLESPTTDKSAVDRCGAELERRLATMGARLQRFPCHEAGDHLRAEFGQGGAQVLLLAHFDTVWPLGHIQEMPLIRADDRLSGPGVFDMKAGIAIGLLAIRALEELAVPSRPRIAMLLTTDEETGSVTSRALIEEEARRSAAVLVLEPALPGGAVKTSRKGCGHFEIRVTGVSAHAGIEPGAGASAIHELAHQIVALEGLLDRDRGISLNVGTVSGGTRPNVVAREARASIDVRVTSMCDAGPVEQALQALRPHLARTTVQVSGSFDRPPLERSPAVAGLYDLARGVARDLGRELGEGSTGGGSDGNFTAALGVPTLDGLGAVGAGAHATHEHIVISELAWRAALVAGLIARVGRATGGVPLHD